MFVSCYLAHKMTGRPLKDLVDEALYYTTHLQRNGFVVYDPILLEGIKYKNGVLENKTTEELRKDWKRDKYYIRKAHVLIDVSEGAQSEGVSHEIGYARYCLWKPVIRIQKFERGKPKISIALLEDDLIVDSVFDAMVEIHKRWGSFTKRLVWRLKMLGRSLPRFVWYQIGGFK